MTGWTLHYHPEITSYLIELRESGTELRRVLRELEQDPRREEAATLNDWPNTYELFVERHRIRYMVLDGEKRIRILLVKPGSEESQPE